MVGTNVAVDPEHYAGGFEAQEQILGVSDGAWY
jgi:hypothetical protein